MRACHPVYNNAYSKSSAYKTKRAIPQYKKSNRVSYVHFILCDDRKHSSKEDESPKEVPRSIFKVLQREVCTLGKPKKELYRNPHSNEQKDDSGPNNRRSNSKGLEHRTILP